MAILPSAAAIATGAKAAVGMAKDAAGQVPPPTTPTAPPAGQREIFRAGQDIYAVEGDSARKLGATEFGRDFAPQAGVVVEGDKERRIGEGDIRDLGQRADLLEKYFPKTEAKPTDTVKEETTAEGIREETTKTKTEVRDDGTVERETTVEDPTQMTPLQQQLKDISDAKVLEMEKYQKDLAERTKTLDARNQRMVDNIKKSFESRRAAQEQINKAVLGGMKVAGARAGRQRYATEIQSSIISSEERAAQQRLADLDAQEAQLILQAEVAAEDSQWEALNKAYSTALQIQDEKAATLIEMNTLAQQEEDRMYKRMDEIRKQEGFQMEVEQYDREIARDVIGQITSDDLVSLSEEDKKQLAQEAGILNLDNYVRGQEEAAQAAADQKEFENAIKQADVTGYFGGEMTSDERQRVQDNYFENTGLVLDQKKFEELQMKNTFERDLKRREFNLKLEESFGNTGTKYQKVNGVDYAVDEFGNLTQPVVPTIPDPEKIQSLDRITSLIDKIGEFDEDGNFKGREGYRESVGLKGVEYLFGLKEKAIAGTQAADVQAAIDSLVNNETLKNMGLIKGVLSDKDMEVLRSAGTELSQAQSQEGFEESLLEIYNNVAKAKYNAENGINYTTAAEAREYTANELASEVQTLTPEEQELFNSYAEGKSIEDANAILQQIRGSSFPNAQGKGVKMSPIERKLDYYSGGRVSQAKSLLYDLQEEYPQNEKYGWCGTFARENANLKSIGITSIQDSYEGKQRQIDEYVKKGKAFRKENWTPLPGDAIVTSRGYPSNPYGHMAIVQSINPDGTLTLAESNAYGDKRTTYNRKLSLNDPKENIYGAFRTDSYT